MTGNAKQKLKLLCLYRMLEQETDTDHGITMTGILQRLADQGIKAERKGIYRDLDVLRSFGLEILVLKRFPVEYALKRSDVTLADLMLIADAVQSSGQLTQRAGKRLVNRLRTLTSTYEGEALVRDIRVIGRVKAQTESVYPSIDLIHEAMRQGHKVRFVCLGYGPDLALAPLNDRRPYVLTPIEVVQVEGIYHLVAWDSQEEAFAAYRIDRMRSLRIADEDADQDERVAGYVPRDAFGWIFDAGGDTRTKVKLRVQQGALDEIADRFGTDLEVRSYKSGAVDVSVMAAASPRFFGWLAGTDGAVAPLAPKSLVEEYRMWLKERAGE